jgi:predicted transcriptional regulator
MRRRPRSPESAPESAFLPEAELEVLALLHRLGEAEAADLRAALQPRRPMTHASVLTLLGRLEQRSLVGRRKADAGKAFVYFATRHPEQTYRSVVGRVAERVFLDDRIGLVSSLFGAKPPSDDEISRLRELVDELEDGRRSRRASARRKHDAG